MAYCTVNDVKHYLGIDGDGDDALIEGIIDAAQIDIDKFTRRKFEATADSTRYFDYSSENIDGYVLYLDEDLCSITTVTNGDSVAVASNEYTTLPKNTTPYYAIRLLSDSGVTWTYSDEWMDAISIAGRWAYSTTAPNAIKQACAELSAFLYRKKDAPFTDITAIEAGVVVTPSAMPATVRMALKPYVRY